MLSQRGSTAPASQGGMKGGVVWTMCILIPDEIPHSCCHLDQSSAMLNEVERSHQG